MARSLSPLLMALLGAVAGTSACEIPTVPLTNNITEPFAIFVQNPGVPVIHNHVMTFRANGDDEHLNLAPAGRPTGDSLTLINGRLITRNIHGVIDLEYDPTDDTTKLFMTERGFHPVAVFQPVYGCDPDTDELQIRLELVSRLLDPPVLGGQIGVQEVVGDYEFRYSPPGNTLVDPGTPFIPVTMVVFRDGSSPPTPTSTATATTTPGGPAATPTAVGDYDFVSCWAEPDGGRALAGTFSAADMTNEKCAAECGLEYFGTQWSIECWCGATLAGGSAAAPADCSYTCSGNSTEICGGGRRLSLYRRRSASGSSTTTAATSTSTSSTTSSTTSTTSTTSSSTTTSSSSTTSSSTSSSATSTSTTSTTTSAAPTGTGVVPSVGTYDFVSCWAEPPTGRALTGPVTSADDMTNEKCASICSSYPYFGTQWNRECFCGLALTEGSAAAPLSECDHVCTGDATQMCGGSRRLSLYHDAGWTGPEQPSSIGDYEFYGCVTDSPSHRTLTASMLASSTMTLEMCATFCAGYEYFGTEYSVECFCGNSFTAGATVVASSQCSMTCGGNTGTWCGNADRLSVYKLTAP